MPRSDQAYEAGRAGKKPAGWILNSAEYMAAYEDGVSDREADLAGAPPREREHADSTGAPAGTGSSGSATSGAGEGTARPGRTARAGARRPPGRRSSSSSGLGNVRPTLSPPGRLSASDGAGFVLGLVLYAPVLNYLAYGKDGVKAWLAAKFLNDTSRAAALPAGKSGLAGIASGGGGGVARQT